MITATPRKLLIDICTNSLVTYIVLLNSIQTFHGHNTISVLSRDRLVVRTLRCGRSNPGSNPGHGMDNFFKKFFKIFSKRVLRRPGIEPGSTAWKAAMLTIIPPTHLINIPWNYASRHSFSEKIIHVATIFNYDFSFIWSFIVLIA